MNEDRQQRRERVLEKIRKLSALAGNNPSAEEAAAAVAQAKRLMRAHDLTEGDVVAAHLKVEHRETKAGAPKDWSQIIANAVGEYTDTVPCRNMTCTRRCDGTKTRGRFDSWSFYGSVSDIEIAVYAFVYLVRSAKRATDAACLKIRVRGRADAKKYRDGYLNGFALGVAEMLREKRAREPADVVQVNGLVVDRRAAIKRALDGAEFKHGGSDGEGFAYYPSAVEAGRAVTLREGLGGQEQPPLFLGGRE